MLDTPSTPLSHWSRLSLKTEFLLVIVSAKWVGELHALSVSAPCLRWNTDGSGVVLWLNVAFLPKVLSPSYVNQPIQLARFVPPLEQSGLQLLCLVQEAYINATASICRCDQRCFDGRRKQDTVCPNRDCPTGLLTPLCMPMCLLATPTTWCAVPLYKRHVCGEWPWGYLCWGLLGLTQHHFQVL